MKMKEESEKVGLKLNIQTSKIMVSSPITSWEIDGETVETVADFIFLGSKITSLGEVSDGQDRSPFLVLSLSSHYTLSTTTTVPIGNRMHPVQEPRDSMLRTWSQLQLLLKSRDITLPTKVHLVKAMVFQVVMYGWM